ncbi:hypothetical protein A2U01_0052238, partial [Trifolium medium]|nr:hypothetical protein [Trifolium medium]
MRLKQSAGKKPIGFDYEVVNQQKGYNKATISTPIEKTFPTSSVLLPSNPTSGGVLPPHPPTHQGTYSWLKAKPKYHVNSEPMPQHPPAHHKN